MYLSTLTFLACVAAFTGSTLASPTVPWSNSRLTLRQNANTTLPGRFTIRQAANSTSPAQVLASGIAINILAQQGEVAVTSLMLNMAQAGMNDPETFAAAKDSLVTFISTVTKIREDNQKMARDNPQVSRGLMKMQQTQVLQFAALQNITGNPVTDTPVLQKLKDSFLSSIDVTKGLQSMAMGGSGIPGSSGSAAWLPSTHLLYAGALVMLVPIFVG